MFIFGLCFILYFLKLSGTNGLLDNIPDKVTRFITKKCIKVYDQSGGT